MTTKWVNVESIGSYFQSLSDPRHTRNRKHLLVDIVVIAICAMVSGSDGPTAIHRWAANRLDWLEGFLPLANGIPSRDCIRRLLMALKPEAFQECFRDWIAQAIHTDSPSVGKLVAIDGKTCRGSHDAAHGLGPLHIVSAWASEEGIALGQVATEEKSNEITAIPELLCQIELADTLVTIDAMGCQKEILGDIVDGGGDFVIAVKDKQPKLREEIAEHFIKHVERATWRICVIATSRPARLDMVGWMSGPTASARSRAILPSKRSGRGSRQSATPCASRAMMTDEKPTRCVITH